MTTIRLAVRHDLASLVDLYRHLHPHDAAMAPDHAEHVWSTLIASGFTHVVVADAGGRLASSCTLALVPNLTRGGRSYGVIENVVTHPAHRRTGLGGRVLARALGIARDAGCYKVMLATGSPEEATLRFYEASGFRRGGKTCFEVRNP